jgi:pyruvate/2-oxoglutarate dehydrogenase complex dihydrolipoamide dehydrogenase (E3) component
MFNFPEIRTVRSTEEQATKVIDEVVEYKFDFSDEEAVDILHAAETLIRIHFKGRPQDLERVIQQTKEKNLKRGYYTSTCF